MNRKLTEDMFTPIHDKSQGSIKNSFIKTGGGESSTHNTLGNYRSRDYESKKKHMQEVAERRERLEQERFDRL